MSPDLTRMHKYICNEKRRPVALQCITKSSTLKGVSRISFLSYIPHCSVTTDRLDEATSRDAAAIQVDAMSRFGMPVVTLGYDKSCLITLQLSKDPRRKGGQ